MKHSAQRDAVLNELSSRHDHPTADELYHELRKTMPNISMGTVYRNLSLLSENGMIQRLTYAGADRFDANTHVHYHLLCTCCKKVFDIEMPILENLNDTAGCHSGAEIKAHQLTFIGICENCKKIN